MPFFVVLFVPLMLLMVVMTTTSVLVFEVAFVVGIAMLGWFLVVNEWTCRDRRRMIHLYHASPDWQELDVLWRAVTYHDHMRRRIMFQDPWAIYDPRLRSLLEKTDDA